MDEVIDLKVFLAIRQSASFIHTRDGAEMKLQLFDCNAAGGDEELIFEKH